MTKAELEKRVAELETELAWRRNHVCPQPYVPVASACTCASGSRRDATFPQPCPVHGFPWRSGFVNICGGAADNGFGNVIITTAGANPNPVRYDTPVNTTGCAPGFAGNVYNLMLPAN